jgi:hypothetical protein
VHVTPSGSTPLILVVTIAGFAIAGIFFSLNLDRAVETMSRTHREIFHLVDILQRQIADLPEESPQSADIVDLRRTLCGLHAILRLHIG